MRRIIRLSRPILPASGRPSVASGRLLRRAAGGLRRLTVLWSERPAHRRERPVYGEERPALCGDLLSCRGSGRFIVVSGQSTATSDRCTAASGHRAARNGQCAAGIDRTVAATYHATFSSGRWVYDTYHLIACIGRCVAVIDHVVAASGRCIAAIDQAIAASDGALRPSTTPLQPLARSAHATIRCSAGP